MYFMQIRQATLFSMIFFVSMPLLARVEAQTFTYQSENDFLSALTSFGYSSFSEDFEADANWGSIRTPASALSISHQGINWTANHVTNTLSTSNGAAHTGSWGIYDSDHGSATGDETTCDVDVPPQECLFHDGISGTRLNGQGNLSAVGGWFSSQGDSNVVALLDESTPINLGKVANSTWIFLGIIETNGFTTFEIRETEGKIGDARLLFADDFTLGIWAPSACTPSSPTDTNCNGIDDDCNGLVDDGYALNASCGVGECNSNNIPSSCTNGVEVPCQPGIPLAENTDLVCSDTLDNDCDGLFDLADQDCGTPPPCTPSGIADNTCNGLDDDCNGLVDDLNPACGNETFHWNLFFPAIIGSSPPTAP